MKRFLFKILSALLIFAIASGVHCSASDKNTSDILPFTDKAAVYNTSSSEQEKETPAENTVNTQQSDFVKLDRKISLSLSNEACYAQYDNSKKLSGKDLIVYNLLKSETEKIAAGQIISSVIVLNIEQIFGKSSWTAEELGAMGADDIIEKGFDYIDISENLELLVNMLLADCPYDLYWYDKSVGMSYEMSGGYYPSDEEFLPVIDYTFTFAVSQDYSDGSSVVIDNGSGDTIYRCGLDTEAVSKAVNAKENAVKIVEKYENSSDYEKLKAYEVEIRQLTAYNHAAAENPDTPYGNPWQIIYVFDDDPNTTVVCEGYAKAFQYLCDLTVFENKSIFCYSVTGTMNSDTSYERHMWNIVTINAKNYLVDATNDDVSVGSLFLKAPEAGTVSTCYSFKCGNSTVNYVYDSNIVKLYSPAELTLAAVDYSVPADIRSLNVLLSVTDFAFDATLKTVAVTVKNGEEVLIENTDYTVSGNSATNAGTYTLTITGKGNYTGSVTRQFTIYNLMDANSDGDINIGDCVVIMKYCTGDIVLDRVQLLSSDVDGDGFVTRADAVMILNFLAKITA